MVRHDITPPSVDSRAARPWTEPGLVLGIPSTQVGTPISRNTFRTRIWLPAVEASGIDFRVRIHDLRHAHASWLLAGGADLKSVMDRMGHAQIQPPRSTCTPSPTPTKEPRRPHPNPRPQLGALVQAPRLPPSARPARP